MIKRLVLNVLFMLVVVSPLSFAEISQQSVIELSDISSQLSKNHNDLKIKLGEANDIGTKFQISSLFEENEKLQIIINSTSELLMVETLHINANQENTNSKALINKIIEHNISYIDERINFLTSTLQVDPYNAYTSQLTKSVIDMQNKGKEALKAINQDNLKSKE